MIQIIVNVFGLIEEIQKLKLNITGKYKDLSTQKYRKELTRNITFKPNKIFVRNDLFEKVIKSCKATNLEFLKLLKKFLKVGLCLYENIRDEKEFVLMPEESFIQHYVENKQLKENKKLKKENENKKRETRNDK